jgi:putative DNA primase/helicase
MYGVYISTPPPGYNKQGESEDFPEWIMVAKNEHGEITKMQLIPGILAEHLRDTEKVFSCNGRIYVYAKGVYKIMGKEALRKIVSEKIPVIIRRKAGIEDVTSQWITLIDKNEMPEHDNNSHVINFQNGLYDIMEDKLKDHDPDYISLVQLPVNYNPKAVCPIWKKEYLGVTQGGGYEDNISALQEWGGYAMSHLTEAQKFLLLIGVPNAGKGLFLRFLTKILGQGNISGIEAHKLADEFKTIELMGKIANICGDIPAKKIADGTIKQLTGEDLMSGRFKGKGEEKFYNKAKLIFSGQTAPDTADPTNGFFRRVCIVPFKNVVKTDTTLEKRMQGELEGIAYFFIQGLKRLIKNEFKFTISESMTEAMEQYREESNTITAFINDMVEFGNGYWISRADFYDNYKDYAYRKHGIKFEHAMKIKEFNSAILNNYPKDATWKDGYKDENRKSHRAWLGIRMKKG